LKIDDLRDESRLLGSASVDPIDVGTQAMSIACVGPAAGTMDLDFGRRLPALFEKLGVRDICHEGMTLTGRGGDPQARFAQMTDELLRERFVAAGVRTEADVDELRRPYDWSFWFVGFTLFGAWGRRPG
jgi:hypothetical protein